MDVVQALADAMQIVLLGKRPPDVPEPVLSPADWLRHPLETAALPGRSGTCWDGPSALGEKHDAATRVKSLKLLIDGRNGGHSIAATGFVDFLAGSVAPACLPEGMGAQNTVEVEAGTTEPYRTKV
ncbi:hypothetical protein SAMN02927900_05913 [Rhizobium mongolense subsp. loessense]|uniref:Uncharacterized protein n=1 Tax=Rhizobium mongolense subsp. loessense TaxID=158890 RepID=A0A1G4U0G6_9HYPH|nr:hypothetical protein SAMN02927900_05913 [Rhizobium mongolense subsp. loessense]